MKYMKQFGIILAISFAGEILNYLVPLPIPASIYGLVLMFLALCFKLIKVEDVKTTSYFMIEIMPMMFIPAAVGLLTSWNVIQSNLIAYVLITVVSTFLVMVISGHITQVMIRMEEKRRGKEIRKVWQSN